MAESRDMIKMQVHDLEECGAEMAMVSIPDGGLKTGFLSVELVYSACHEGIAV